MSKVLTTVNRFFPDVKIVKDAKVNALIEVSPRDVANAERRSHKTCAMAVACKKKFELDGVIISVNTAYLVKGREATRYKLPGSVAREIVSYDRSGEFAPGEYQLTKPPKGKRLGDTGGHSGKEGNGKPLRHRHMTSGIRTVLGGKAPKEA